MGGRQSNESGSTAVQPPVRTAGSRSPHEASQQRLFSSISTAAESPSSTHHRSEDHSSGTPLSSHLHTLSYTQPHTSASSSLSTSHRQRGESSSFSTNSLSQPSSQRDRPRRSHQYEQRRADFIDLESLGLPAPIHRHHHRHHRTPTGEGTTSGETSGSRGERRHHRSRGSHDHISTSAPSFLFVRGISRATCPLCSKEFMATEMQEHLILCMTRPRVSFNEDKLTHDAGECSICLDDMLEGDQIARLPCLCIYHSKCLREWYKVNMTCPEHPEFYT